MLFVLLHEGSLMGVKLGYVTATVCAVGAGLFLWRQAAAQAVAPMALYTIQRIEATTTGNVQIEVSPAYGGTGACSDQPVLEVERDDESSLVKLLIAAHLAGRSIEIVEAESLGWCSLHAAAMR